MNCERYDAQWTDYLDQTLSFRERQDLEAHLRLCSNCSAQFHALQEADQRLRIECGLVRESIAPSGDAQSAAQDRVLSALRRTAPGGGVHERLWRVRWVLAHLCGSNTATRIIQAAESHTEVSASATPSEQKWLVFLRRLSFLTTEVCGCSAGELIWAVGN